MISTDWEVTRIAQSVETIAEANGVPVQVTVNHESFGVCAIQERSDNWSWGTYTFLQYRESLSNMEPDVLSVCQGFKAYLLERLWGSTLRYLRERV